MTPEQLKTSIFQYAIQGKLVEQRPEEGSAVMVYEKIQEKSKQIKAKKRKKLPEIGDNELPFEIPDVWKWVRIGDVCNIINGFTPKRSNTEFWTNGTIPWFTIEDVRRQGRFIESTEQFITEKALSKDSERIVPAETVLLCCTASVGEYAYTKIPLTTNQQFNALVVREEYKEFISSLYIYQFVQTLKGQLISNAGKTTFNFLSVGKLSEMLVPVPPLDEQHRIVAKIEELLPYVDRYAEAYEKIEQFNAKFPEDMKKSILQYAIQGKLVEQRPEEGTAEDLYQQVLKEKKQYKIKELSLESINEAPFDIPETWKWVYLQDVVKKTIKRGKSPKYTEKSNVQVFAQKCNVKTGGINMGLALFLDETVIGKYPSEEFMCDCDIVINSTGGGTMGRVGLFQDADRIDNMPIVPDGHVTVIRSCDTIDHRFLFYYLKHNQKYLETQGDGSTNQTELKPVTIASLLLPLPPLEEQHRIVAKIEELLPFVDRLAKNDK